MNANLVEIQNQEEQNWIHSKSNSLSFSLISTLSKSNFYTNTACTQVNMFDGYIIGLLEFQLTVYL